jgi:hypothetical protein
MTTRAQLASGLRDLGARRARRPVASGIAPNDLFERIVASSAPRGSQPAERLRPLGGLRGRLRGWHLIAIRAGVALAVVAVAGALVWIAFATSGGGPSGVPGHPTFAEAAVKVAEANQRLLVTEPGWSVARADEFTPTDGEVNFSDGNHELDVRWYPASDYQLYLNDRKDADPSPTTVTVAGQEATLFRYQGTTDFATILPPQGPNFVEVRGDLGSQEAYLKILQSLQSTDVDTWLSAMPPSVVKPSDRPTVVDQMLNGIPIPPGLDLDKLRNENAVLDRYQLFADVTGTVACGWVDRWLSAKAAGDTARAEQAVRAMNTAPSWPILRQMAGQGGWGPVVVHYAHLMAAGNVADIRATYQQGLDCISH